VLVVSHLAVDFHPVASELESLHSQRVELTIAVGPVANLSLHSKSKQTGFEQLVNQLRNFAVHTIARSQPGEGRAGRAGMVPYLHEAALGNDIDEVPYDEGAIDVVARVLRACNLSRTQPPPHYATNVIGPADAHSWSPLLLL
jgi:hypothetical protein